MYIIKPTCGGYTFQGMCLSVGLLQVFGVDEVVVVILCLVSAKNEHFSLLAVPFDIKHRQSNIFSRCNYMYLLGMFRSTYFVIRTSVFAFFI